MKKILLQLFVIIIIVLSESTDAQWIMVNALPQLNYLESVKFINTTIGFSVGGEGTILKTIDGGTNWIAQTSGITNTLHDVCFPDINNGTAVGDSGIILRTTNAGISWSQQTSGKENNLYGVNQQYLISVITNVRASVHH